MKSLFTFLRPLSLGLCAAAMSALLSSCGGGGGADEFGPPTIRPKTLFQVQMGLDAFVNIQFYPTADTATALRDGDIETGSFDYNLLGAEDGPIGDTYLDVNNELSDAFFSIRVTGGTYTYRALNTNQAVLTMTGIGQAPLAPYPHRSTPTANPSLMVLFAFTTPAPFPIVTNIVEVLMTFDEDAGFVLFETGTVGLPESPFVNSYDTVRMPISGFSLFDGERVPIDYIGPEDPDGYGNIVAPTLDGFLFTGTNGIPDITKNFRLDFTADFTGLDSGTDGLLPEEIGTCIISVDNGAGTGVLEAVSGAADYTWRRIRGGNTGELVLSNITDGPYPFDSQFNGSYILDFVALDSGSYTGANPNLTGTFVIVD